MKKIVTQKKEDPFITRFTLKIGEWRKLFPEAVYKLMIAKSLNYCVYNEAENPDHEFELDIEGYLITRYRVYLQVRIDPLQVNRMLQFFYEKIREEIRQGFDKIKRKVTADNESTILMEAPYLHLFEKHPLANGMLVRLITGQEIKLKYHNPYLERMKDVIHGNNFCSAIDYAGGESLVEVTIRNASTKH